MSLLKAFDPMVNLFRTKHQIEREITELKGAIIEAERALSNCDILEKEIPTRIATVRSRIAVPHLFDELDRSNAYPEFARDMKIVRALQRLKQDLPAIRTHWEKRQRALAA